MRLLSQLIFIFFSINIVLAQCPVELVFDEQSDIDTFLLKHHTCKKLKSLSIRDNVYDISALIQHLDTIQAFGLSNSQLTYLDISQKNTNSFSFIDNPNLDSVFISSKSDKVFGVTFDLNPQLIKIVYNLANVDRLQLSWNNPDSLIFENKSQNFRVKDFNSFGNVIFSGNRFKITESSQIGENNVIKSYKNISPYIDIDSIKSIDFFLIDSFDFKDIENNSYFNEFKLSYINNLDLTGFYEANIEFNILGLGSCKNVKSLQPFQNCKTSALIIGSLDSINSLDGIVFKHNTASLSLLNNISLNDISAVNSIDSFKNLSGTLINTPALYIQNNPDLSICNYDVICKTIQNVDASLKIDIRGNSGECETIETLKQVCIVNTYDEIESIKFTYNSGYLTLFNGDGYLYKVIDTSGRILEKKEYNSQIELKKFEKGIYIIHLFKNDILHSLKVVNY